ncbi:MazG-like family protein [Ochrobactrum vermis]|uniref:MazG-like family protein n=1 Tax=Ochrobactrum vermis TaxID=1827297 RepID=A0ABU8PAI7_9HYPH|nr:MazG-like family protein [Ochrobactrum vermis]PQZ29761.1 hypothetical protein CQZ93_06010 [Ochrobactrum vermis]
MTIPDEAVQAAVSAMCKSDPIAYGNAFDKQKEKARRILTAALPFLQGVTLGQLQQAHVERQEEWCPDQKPDLSFRGNEMAGEVGEACNVIKKLERERQGWRGSRATKQQLADELADVVHTAILCAITAGIDLAPAVVEKFNSTSEKNGLSTTLSVTDPSPRAQALEEGDLRELLERLDAGLEYEGDLETENDHIELFNVEAAQELFSDAAAAIRALSSQPVADHIADAGKTVADGGKGEWREIEISHALKGRRVNPAYSPAIGEVCEISGPNCDDDKGYTWGETTVLWQNEMFVLYGKAGYWPVLHKHEYVLFRPLPASPGGSE